MMGYNIFDVLMKIPFERMFKIVLSIFVLECYSSQAFTEHFSKQYNELLNLVSLKNVKPQKCYINDNFTTYSQAIDIYFKPITTAVPTLNQEEHAKKIVPSLDSKELTLVEACSIICEQISYVLIQLWSDFQTVYLMRKNSSSIEYFQNFANINGGAMILSISSKRIQAPQALLQDNNDKYMFTDEQLPLQIIIALKEEVSIDRVVIKSNQYYSSTVREFIFYGAFSLEKGQENWLRLVSAEAKNYVGEQQFRTVNKVIRFLKLKVVSSYGDWKYFTMTQIKVYGNSLYAEAMNHKLKEQTSNIVLQSDVDLSTMDLYEDLKKMIIMARDGNRVIPQNNLIKYFFQELQKLSKIEQQQILYMNDLTIKIQGLENQTQEPKEQSEQMKTVRQSMLNLQGQITELLSKEEEWPQSTLVYICVISSFLVTSAIFSIIFLLVFKDTKMAKIASPSNSIFETQKYIDGENQKKNYKKPKSKDKKR